MKKEYPKRYFRHDFMQTTSCIRRGLCVEYLKGIRDKRKKKDLSLEEGATFA